MSHLEHIAETFLFKTFNFNNKEFFGCINNYIHRYHGDFLLTKSQGGFYGIKIANARLMRNITDDESIYVHRIIVTSWTECEKIVKGLHCTYKRFQSWNDAVDYCTN